MHRTALFIACTIVLAGCASVPASEPPAVAAATLNSPDGRTLGTIALQPRGVGYRLSGTLTMLAAGEHGVHLHAIAKCEGPGFASAGPHLNPGLHEHGAMNPRGAHLGDLINLVADQSGHAEFAADLRGQRGDLDQALFDGDGTALVIHAGPDDYRTDPSGNSGTRIACGVLTRN